MKETIGGIAFYAVLLFAIAFILSSCTMSCDDELLTKEERFECRYEQGSPTSHHGY